MAGGGQRAVAWECGVPEVYCMGAYQAKIRGPIKNKTYKFHGSPASVKQCYSNYQKLIAAGKVSNESEPVKSKRE